MPKIRILLVDDSAVVRRVVGDLLAGDEALEVAGTAANGRIALEKLPQVKPDLVILDVEMPELDGLATLQTLRKLYPRLPVLMFSQHTQRGAAATLDALAQGANDYLTKPEASEPNALERTRVQLLDKVKGLCTPAVLARASWPGGAGGRSPLEAPPRRVEAVAVGVSTGGPNALAAILPILPDTFPVPILIVQHMPPLFTRLLAERLRQACRLAVCEVQTGEALSPGGVYLCPGDQHFELKRDGAVVRAQLTQGPPENSCRPSVDVLFRSAVQQFGSGVLGVVLTGMGQDGLKGAERIRDAGGAVLCQDEATSVVWGMPGAVARAGLATRVLPLDQFPGELLTCVRHGRSPSARGC